MWPPPFAGVAPGASATRSTTTASRKRLPPPGSAATVRSPLHRLGDALDGGQAQPRTTVAACDLLVGLGERPKQPPDLGRGEADARVGYGEAELHLAASDLLAGHLEPHASALRELHGIVDEIFHGRPQPQRVADHRFRQFAGNVGLGLETFGFGASGERSGKPLRKPFWADELAPQCETLGIAACGIDDERCEHGEMLGGALDRIGPAALALAEARGCQQLAQRQYPGERRSNFVGKVSESRFDAGRRVHARR